MFEYRLTFAEVMGNSLVILYFDSQRSSAMLAKPARVVFILWFCRVPVVTNKQTTLGYDTRL